MNIQRLKELQKTRGTAYLGRKAMENLGGRGRAILSSWKYEGGEDLVLGSKVKIETDRLSTLHIGSACRIQDMAVLRSVARVAGGKPSTLRLGDRVLLKDRSLVSVQSGELVLGDDVGVGQLSRIDVDSATLRIGAHTRIAPWCAILTGTHGTESLEIPVHEQAHEYGDITIGANVWVGQGSYILPGVRVGAHAIIGAGSIVTKNVDAYAVVVGRPARQIRDRRDTKNKV